MASSVTLTATSPALSFAIEPSLFSVLKCELERRPRNTESLGTDDRASRLERLQCHRRPRPFTRASTSQLGLQLLLPAEQAVRRHAHLLEDHLGRVRSADAHLLLLLARLEPGSALGDHERGLAAGA